MMKMVHRPSRGVTLRVLFLIACFALAMTIYRMHSDPQTQSLSPCRLPTWRDTRTTTTTPTNATRVTMTTVARTNAARRHLLRQRCQLYGEANATSASSGKWKSRLLVVDKYKLVYCSVPKAGNTNWKRVLLSLLLPSGGRPPETVSFHEAHHSPSLLRPLSSYPSDDQQSIMRTYYKFVFARDPLSRLLSAFRNKVLGVGGVDDNHRKLLVPLLMRGRGDVGDAWTEFRRKPPTLAEFVDYVIQCHERRGTLNVHWSPVADLCNVCGVDYDFVGKMETVADDARFVLAVHGLADVVVYPERRDTGYEAAEETAGELRREYQGIPARDLAKIVAMFAKDFDVFNYSLFDHYV
ncbi:PREDICTED: carbohydrate sulfotransferase 13-like isoform X2 [Priapulus caudatus]|uniref:Carbohydrate sulfotransferase n=1 Tax=Priapulus caudatus TaxID=37621 RepID=A0ABM1F993_PRICU|nr:PREDICTED: carbohydrate sulfotransferase 13-like isoform X2 [Priapulus caudatus]